MTALVSSPDTNATRFYLGIPAYFYNHIDIKYTLTEFPNVVSRLMPENTVPSTITNNISYLSLG